MFSLMPPRHIPTLPKGGRDVDMLGTALVHAIAAANAALPRPSG
jgi:hypothetical protein